MCIGYELLLSQFLIIPEYSIMSKSERSIAGYTGEGMIVVVVFFIALGSHTGMPHDSSCAIRRIEMKLVRRFGPLIDYYLTVLDIADTGSICVTKKPRSIAFLPTNLYLAMA